MYKKLSLLAAGALLAGVTIAQPAHAQWHRGYGGGYGWHHHGGGGWAGPAVAAGVLGLGAAAIIASQPHYYAPAPTYYAPPPVYYAPPPAYYYPPY